MKYPPALCLLLTTACTGILDGGQEPWSDGPRGGAGEAVAPPEVTPSASARPPFAVRIGKPELLPFDVRVRRIASVLQVSTSHGMFAEMSSKNVQLGDYDHAAGALPDNLWLARRVATWADALTPVCGSSEMKARYSTLPSDLPQLIEAAWGRTASEEELNEFRTAVAEANLPDALAYEAVCMAVFTAGEFVLR